jgi:predicted HAD superfamily Cof-like phosphohydrolase
MLREYHGAFGEQPHLEPTLLAPEVATLRRTLLTEELAEVLAELESGDLVALAHELADLVYVAYGTAVSAGIDLDAVLAEVHAANMSKIGTDGSFELRADGKLLKGPNYRAPDIAEVLRRQSR